MIGRSGKISDPDMYVVSAFDCFNLGSDLNFNGGYRMLYFPIDSQKKFMLSKFDPVLLNELATKPVVLTLNTIVLLLIASDTTPPGDTS